MTMTTHIRFLDPIDPRAVWAAGRGLIHAPLDYRWDRIRPYEVLEGTNVSWPNHRWSADIDQGAYALMSMEFGHEGALLKDEPDEELDGTPIPLPPPAYVELNFDQPYNSCDAAQHDAWWGLIAVLVAPDPRRVYWMRGECCGSWHRVPESKLLDALDADGKFAYRWPRWEEGDMMSPPFAFGNPRRRPAR